MSKSIPNNFQPEYIERKWTIRHDITGSVIVREINVKQNDWIKYLIWGSDGLPNSHPTFILVLYNHNVRNQLHKLGSVSLNIEDINTYTTVHDFSKLWSNNDNHKQLQNRDFTFYLTFLELSPIM